MEYKREDLSSVKKKITMSVPSDVVDASIEEAARNMQQTVKLDGFRQGKAPMGLVETRFHQEIYADAINKILSDNLERVLAETGLEPVSGVSFEEGSMIERGKDFTYSITFEVMPVFDIPKYEGVAVDEYVTLVTQDQIQGTIDRVRHQIAEVKEPGDRLPKDGDLLTLNFTATDKDGNVVEKVQAEGFQMTVGEGQVIPDFEKIATGLKKGQKGEGKMTFPKDYHDEELAGQTVNLSLEMADHQELILPEIDEKFAKMMANMETVEELYAYVGDILQRSLNTDSKAKTQQALLDQLLAEVEFELPETLVTRQLATMTRDLQMNLIKSEMPAEDKVKALDAVKERMRPQAEAMIRSQLFLLQIAKQQGLAINDYEIDTHLRRMAQQNQQPYEKLKEEVEKNNLQSSISERLLTIKALDYIYDKAVITKKELKEGEEPAPAKAAKPAKKAAAKSAEKPAKAAAPKGDTAKKVEKEAKPKADKKPAEKKTAAKKPAAKKDK